MWITAFFTRKGTPETGLSPSVTVIDLADNSIIVNAQAMSEVSGGWYKYDFSAYDAHKDYALWATSNDVTMSTSDRFKYGGTDLSITVNTGE